MACHFACDVSCCLPRPHGGADRHGTCGGDFYQKTVAFTTV